MFIPDSAQTYASHKLFILYFPQCWIIAVFHRRMKLPNKIIHNKLLSGEKITSLYSFGGTCILKGCLKRKHLTQRGQNLGGKFQPSGRQLGRYMGGRNNILLSLETPHGDYLLTTFLKMIVIYKISFSLSSAHFWHLNPMLDCKILRESKDKSVYKNKQSICIDMT